MHLRYVLLDTQSARDSYYICVLSTVDLEKLSGANCWIIVALFSSYFQTFGTAVHCLEKLDFKIRQELKHNQNII